MRWWHRTLVILALAGAAALPLNPARGQSAPAREPPNYADRAEVREFIDEMASKHGFDPLLLATQFARTRFQPNIVRYMEPLPRGQRSWFVYRSRFVHPKNVTDGAQFWRMHSAALTRAAAEYGVPAEIIVAIIGIETQYGRSQGTWRVLEALATLSFDFPRRADYFRSELEQFLLYTRESRLDPLAIRGSFAGAVGIPQFMPGSYRRWAVDFDGDGRRDLLASPIDAIGSVANFLREHGWRRGEPTAFRAAVTDERHELLLAAGIEPRFRASELASYGITVERELEENTPLALIELETPGEPSLFYVGLQNFYAITRYNQSSFYAMSVIELGAALAHEYRRVAGTERTLAR